MRESAVAHHREEERAAAAAANVVRGAIAVPKHVCRTSDEAELVPLDAGERLEAAPVALRHCEQ